MIIRPYRPDDRREWLRMRRTLWPDIPARDAEVREADEWLSRKDAAVIIAQREGEDGLVGFAEVGERPYADGCDTSPVAFLEGWYVDSHIRNQHVGKTLIEAVEAWARINGYRELASDSLLEEIAAHKAHLAVGFEEVERAVRFRKAL